MRFIMETPAEFAKVGLRLLASEAFVGLIPLKKQWLVSLFLHSQWYLGCFRDVCTWELFIAVTLTFPEVF